MRHFLGISLLLAAAGSAQAATTFYMQYSGLAFANDATASGTIVIDEALLPNPGNTQFADAFGLVVLDLNLVVSGASSGNGTFTLADFDGWIWSTGGATLDLGAQLVGQSTNGGPWGSGESGDFNLFSAPSGGAPVGWAPFTLKLASGYGEEIALTSFSSVPEPSTYGLLLGGLALAGAAIRRRKVSR